MTGRGRPPKAESEKQQRVGPFTVPPIVERHIKGQRGQSAYIAKIVRRDMMQSSEIETTIAEVESAWGHSYSEWPLLGSPVESTSEVLYLEPSCQDEPEGTWNLLRVAEDGIRYGAIDGGITIEDVKAIVHGRNA